VRLYFRLRRGAVVRGERLAPRIRFLELGETSVASSSVLEGIVRWHNARTQPRIS
jgi:hypothetical protein